MTNPTASSLRPWPRGYVQVYTGSGKGKTSAALGLALRAAGAGLPVFIGQFVKGEPCSELVALKRLGGLVTVKQFGLGRFIVDEPSPGDIDAARRGLRQSLDALTGGQYRVVILDELSVAVDLKLLTMDEAMELIDARPAAVELIITGRNAPPEIVARADLVTEMKAVRHYYDEGIEGRVGIEK